MIIVLIIGVVIAFLVWFFFLRKKPEEPQLSIFFQPSDIILNPANRTVETYVLEYATTPENLGKYVDLEIRWNNGFGFTNAGVTGFVLRRKIVDPKDSSKYKYINVSPSGVADPTKLTVTTDAKLGNEVNVKDGEECTVKILGDYIGDSDQVVGNNIIEVHAIVGVEEIEVGALPVNITQDHLDKTLKISQVERITFDPVNATSFGYDVITDSTIVNFAPDRLETPTIKTKLLKESGSNKIVIQEDVGGSLKKGDKYVISSYQSDPIKYIFSQTTAVPGQDRYIVYEGEAIKTVTLTKAQLRPTVLFDDKTTMSASTESAKRSSR